MNVIIKEAIKILVDRLVDQIANSDYKNSKGELLTDNKAFKELLKYFDEDYAHQIIEQMPNA